MHDVPFPKWTKWHRTIIPALGKKGGAGKLEVQGQSEYLVSSRPSKGGERPHRKITTKQTNEKPGWGVVQLVVRVA